MKPLCATLKCRRFLNKKFRENSDVTNLNDSILSMPGLLPVSIMNIQKGSMCCRL